MGRSRYKIYETALPHFLTMTVVDWLPIFANPDLANIVLESLRFMQRKKQVKIYAYVLMENHLHCIVQSENLGKKIQALKSYTARAIIDYCEEHNNHTLLEKLRRNKLHHKAQSMYQVWQEGSHPVEMTTEKKMWQTMEYIHNNPIRRGYVDDTNYWRYSSARNYAGEQGLLDVQTEW